MARPRSLELDYFQYANGDVDIYRRIRNKWVLWVLVRDSAAMARVNAHGKGLYAARGFNRDEFIGRYVGKILGKATDPKVEKDVERRSHMLDGDAIINVNGYYVDGRARVQSNDAQTSKFGRIVLAQPQWKWPGVYAHIANDATGTGLSNNCLVTEGGYMHATKRIPKFNFGADVHNNSASELLWSYGEGYWANQGKLGTYEMPIVIE